MSGTFRNYESKEGDNIVRDHYRLMRSRQTLEFVTGMEGKWFNFDHGCFTVKEAFEKLSGYVDSSDPDVDFPNALHAFQTAESIRKEGHPDWLQLVGLLHDLGKIMFLWGKESEGQVGTAHGPQWALGGDTWVVGCQIPDCVVFPEFNELNPDQSHYVYASKCGIYEKNCGLGALKFAFGHDEYMYRVLKNAETRIPEVGLQIIRLHSCYPLHESRAYDHLLAEGDEEVLQYVKLFNKYDLYTKSDEKPDPNKLWPYYEDLMKKYRVGKLSW